MTYVYNDETGEITVDETALRAGVVEEFRNALGANFPDDGAGANTVESRWVDAETSSRASILRSNAALANQINPPQSRDIYLDGLGALNIVSRRTQGSRSTVNIIFGGVQGTVIPRGSLVTSTDDSTIIFRTTIEDTIDSFSLAIIPTENTVIGAVEVPTGTINALVTPIEGVNAVTQSDNALPGFDIETDTNESFSRRRNTSLGLQTVGTLLAQSSTLNNFPGIRDSIIIENDTETNNDIGGGFVISPRSVLVIVQPEGDLTFPSTGPDSIRLATALLARKAVGVRWSSSGNASVARREVIQEPTTGQTYTVFYFLAQEITIDVLYRATAPNLSNLEIQNIARNAILSYENGEIQGQPPIRLGTDISSFELAGAINAANPSITINRIETNALPPDSLNDLVFTPDLKIIQPYQVARFGSIIRNNLPNNSTNPIYATVFFDKGEGNSSDNVAIPRGLRILATNDDIPEGERPVFYVFRRTESGTASQTFAVIVISYEFQGLLTRGNIGEVLDTNLLPEETTIVRGTSVESSTAVTNAGGWGTTVTFTKDPNIEIRLPQGFRIGPPIMGPTIPVGTPTFFILNDVVAPAGVGENTFTAEATSWEATADVLGADALVGLPEQVIRQGAGQQNLTGLGGISASTEPTLR